MAHEKLRAEIKKRFGSEATLARKMGWSRQRMSNLVRGRKVIKISDVNILSRGMGIPVAEVIDLIDLEEDERKNIGRQGGNLSGLHRLALKSLEQTADFG